MAWKELDNNSYNEVWDKFNKELDFNPYGSHDKAIHTEYPILKYNIKRLFNPEFDISKMENYALELFQAITEPGEKMYALDWQHPAYEFDPRGEMERDEFGEWKVPIFPNGDYYIFLTQDFQNVWFGHPWEPSITLIGKKLIDLAKQGTTSIDRF